jgi:hypothetical protein
MLVGASCRYEPKKHWLVELQCLRDLKNHVKDKAIKNQLFSYFHRREGTWVIGMWVDEGHHLFVDALNMGKSLKNLSKDMFQSILLRLNSPVTADETRRFIRDTEHEGTSRLQDEADGDSERMKWNSSPRKIMAVV